MIDTIEAPVDQTSSRPRGGPQTREGKDRSRRNALKHGLRAKVLLPDDLAAAVAERTQEFSDQFDPRSGYEEFLVSEMGLASARLSRCAEMSLADLRRCVERAGLCWEADRRQFVEDLGARLTKDPARVSRALRGTTQGADWLLERWEGLADCLQSNGAWDDAQRRLAFDLLGVALDLRAGSTRVPAADNAVWIGALIEGETERLRESQADGLNGLDEAERSMAVAGMPMSEDATTKRLRRYESTCRRALVWARAELARVQSGSDSPPPELDSKPSVSKAGLDALVTRSESYHEAIHPRLAEEPAAESAAPLMKPPVAVRLAPSPAASGNRRARRAHAANQRRTSTV